MSRYEALKLENQLCFPLYAAAKGIVRLYTPHLNELKLTYTQYIVMMVLWEDKQIAVKELGERLFLDTGTLTPLLKKLQLKGYITLSKAEEDRRSVLAAITENGLAVREEALKLPEIIGGCIPLNAAEMKQLYDLTHKLLRKIPESNVYKQEC
ncbi:MarR family winged helix-turn-helix transcriptional regulator [Scatolibacter rhodanostii]|uniref:MarR family winged helix-turn-helix transcriptional regulator n=1 Tax=Scatolibacter rhodanostii TaxID=2014781 RepID=UPI000C081B54|nr:MarR family transcriptional regulator [Scatolibacter rhodanostii]